MNIIEVRLFEVALKGDRLDEINAEEILDRRAAAQERATARWRYIQGIGQQWLAWVTRGCRVTAMPVGAVTK